MTGTCLTGRLILCPVGRAPVQKLQLSVLDSRRVTAVHKLADRLFARPFTPNQTFPARRNCESIQLFAMISFRIVEITCYATYIRFWAPKPDRFLVWLMHILRLTQLIFFSTNSKFRKFQAKKSNTKKGIWHFFRYIQLPLYCPIEDEKWPSSQTWLYCTKWSICKVKI